MRLLGFILGAIRGRFEKKDDPLEVAMNEITKEHLLVVLNNLDNDSPEYKNTIN